MTAVDSLSGVLEAYGNPPPLTYGEQVLMKVAWWQRALAAIDEGNMDAEDGGTESI